MRLVVVEDGTNGAEDHALPNGADDTVLIAQGGGERPLDFAQRVIRRISAIEKLDQSVVSTALLLSPRFDADATAARVALAHKLMAHSAVESASSQFLLSAGSELHPIVQLKVVAFADRLKADPGGNHLLIRVQFSAGAEPAVSSAPVDGSTEEPMPRGVTSGLR